MNKINLKGYIRNIQNSHIINDTQYQSADMIVQSKAGIQDTIRIVFKQCIQIPCEDDVITLTGSVRSHTEQLEDKNKVSIYVSTYFDKPQDQINNNEVILDGRICKIDQLRTTSTGKLNFHATLANNIYVPEFNIKINKVKEMLKKIEGIVIVVANAPIPKIEQEAKHNLQLFFIQADTEFRL